MSKYDMTKLAGCSLTLFYINGRPAGMVTAEMFNWTGHVLTIPRLQLKEGLVRKETSYTGVYLLWGEDKEVYIGEAENTRKRIKRHAGASEVENAKQRTGNPAVSEDWWTNVAIITTAANNMNKAHVQYLESRLIKIAKKVGRANLKNSAEPELPSLSEADQADMESFLENVLLVLPPLGIDWFIDDARPDTTLDTSDGGSERGASPTFELKIPRYKIRATAVRMKDGEFVVQKGSQAKSEWGGARHPSYTDLFKRLRDRGILEKAENRAHCVFTENYAFNSTSAAGAVVSGRTCRGPEEWKTKDDGKTYAKWETETLQSEKPKSKKSESKKPRPKKPKAKK